jgi:hypothetical protein
VTELTPAQKIERGRTAQRLLDDSLVESVLDDARKDLLDEWLKVEGYDPEMSRNVWAVARAVDILRARLRKIAGDGLIAEKADLLRTQ